MHPNAAAQAARALPRLPLRGRCGLGCGLPGVPEGLQGCAWAPTREHGRIRAGAPEGARGGNAK
eukprot:2998087-Alexandrium_andersonii.AAC.1